eukprot:7968603-Pyramimonas_sp.AAC.1
MFRSGRSARRHHSQGEEEAQRSPRCLSALRLIAKLNDSPPQHASIEELRLAAAERESERDASRGLQGRGLPEVQRPTCPPCAGRGEAKQMVHGDQKDKVASETETSKNKRGEIGAEDKGSMVMEAAAVTNVMRRRPVVVTTENTLLPTLHTASCDPCS